MMLADYMLQVMKEENCKSITSNDKKILKKVALISGAKITDENLGELVYRVKSTKRGRELFNVDTYRSGSNKYLAMYIKDDRA